MNLQAEKNIVILQPIQNKKILFRDSETGFFFIYELIYFVKIAVTVS
jgi:hypothetical protein